MSQNLYVTGDGNVTDRHPSIICQQIGQTQKWMDITHKKSCNEDTFSTPPFIFEKIKNGEIWNMDRIVWKNDVIYNFCFVYLFIFAIWGFF